MNSIIKRGKRFFIRLANTIYWMCIPNDRLLYIKSGTIQHFGKNVIYNLGDDLNYYILREITNKRIVNIKDTFLKKRNYLFIGSIIEKYCDSNSIIWGAGAMYGDYTLKSKPIEVRAVRGILTREYLEKQGISCPNTYGDPALLLPYIYKPRVEKRYKLGIIPHYVDKDNSEVLGLHHKIKDSTIINMVGYSHWHEVIDKIAQCEMIISSSLHGLILSDAYDIPNVWFTVSTSIRGGRFKFLDYFSSVGRKQECIKLNERPLVYDDIKRMVASYRPISFNVEHFINCCPFEIDPKFVDRIHRG